MDSSRTPIVDIVENIGECIAIQSHLWELYCSISNEMEENYKDMNEVERVEYLNDKSSEMENIKKMYEESYRKRKKLMNILLEEFADNVNMDYRCLVKHSVASRQFSKELWDTNRDNLEYEELYIKSSEVMYSILSKFLWVKEIVKCWRCLLDQLWE